MPRPLHNKFIAIIQHLGLDHRTAPRLRSEMFRWHAECCVTSPGGLAHETSDSPDPLECRTSTRRRWMRQPHDARDDDDNATVIEWNTGRYDFTWIAR